MGTNRRLSVKPALGKPRRPMMEGQQRVYDLRVLGKTFREIADEMKIPKSRAEARFKAAGRKLGLSPTRIAYLGGRRESRQKSDITKWMARYVPELIQTPNREIFSRNITEAIQLRFPGLQTITIYKRYTRPLLRGLAQAGFIRTAGNHPRLRYFVNAPEDRPNEK